MNRSGAAAVDQCPDAIGVVIPARNEQELLAACLSSVVEAAGRLDIPTRIVVALDRCTDRSAAIVAEFRAAGFPVRPVAVPRPGVGAARAAGVRALLAEHPTEWLWLASTDADSEVPADWLVRQLAHVRRGAEVVIGTVRVTDWSPQPAGTRERFAAAYRPEFGHRHRHGANLSFSSTRYLAVGGFAELPCDEDVDLIARLEAAGSAMVWAAELAVTTSARRVGRAPAGFADYLAGLTEVADDVG